METNLVNAIVAAAGILILSEALILVAAMNILKIGDWSWLTLKNNLFLLMDISGGILLVWLATINHDDRFSLYLILIISWQLISHIFRTVEHFVRSEKRFCNNHVLIIFNRVKILALLSILYLVIT